MKISVITVNFNNRNGLARTLESSVSLRAPVDGEKEIIIIDGGSTDGSVEEIRKHENEIVYWCSERDRGIFHAMNKGVARATGE